MQQEQPMSLTLTLDPITLPAPATRTAPTPWPRPEPTPDEAADLFDLHHVRPEPYTFLNEVSPYSSPGPCGCLVGVLTVDAIGTVAAAQAAILKRRSANEALATATGWDPDFVEGIDYGFTPGFSVHDREYTDPCENVAWRRGLALGAATHQVLRDRGMLP
jgi:hypothetical protein